MKMEMPRLNYAFLGVSLAVLAGGGWLLGGDNGAGFGLSVWAAIAIYSVKTYYGWTLKHDQDP